MVKWDGNCKIIVERKVVRPFFKDVLGTSSNFVNHLTCKHATEYSEFKEKSKPSNHHLSGSGGPVQISRKKSFEKAERSCLKRLFVYICHEY